MKTLSMLMFSLLTLVAWQAPAQADTYREGVDYELLPQPGNVEVPGKQEVREFFWFGCPHCFALEEPLEAWRKSLPADVNFVRTPAPMNDSWIPHAHAYYVAEALGKTDAITIALFNAIHVKKQRIFTQDELAGFFKQFDVSEDEFNKLYNSFSVRVKVRQAEALVKTYRLRGVPALVVNAKYLVKAREGSTPAAMFNVVNYLLDKERVAGKIAAPAQ